jgi:aryl-alcohol dehydrogenase-like predicted oxidoreductase
MKTRMLGQLAVSEIGFGTMSFAAAYGDVVDEADAIATLRGAVDLGITLFDTAEAYGPLTNEILVGKALAPVRDQVVIATKFGWHINPETGEREFKLNSKPDHIARVAEQMLQRLGTDHIDLLYQHRVDPEVPIEDVAGAVQRLIEAGKVKHFGLSEASADTIRRAHAVQPVAAVQSEYSLWTREPEPDVLPLCAQLGIGFVPFAPLGSGFLTGRFDATTEFAPGDFRGHSPRFTPEARAANMVLVDLVRAIANRKGATPAQIALAWLLARGPNIVPIFGSTKLSRIEENIGAAAVQMTAADMAEIEQACAAITIEGLRLPEIVLQFSYQ